MTLKVHLRSSSPRRKFPLVAIACVFTAAISAALAQAPGPAQLQKQFRQALALAEQGQPSSALSLTENILARNPGYAPALKLKGMILEDSGRRDEANQAYAEGLKHSPNDPDLLFKVGVYQLVKGDWAASTVLLEKYVRLNPHDADGFFYLAQSEHLTGKDDQALGAIRAALKLKPNSTEIWQKYGELLVSSGESEEGLDWLKKSQQANPGLTRIDFDLGVASLHRMDLQGAEQYATRAVASEPTNLEAQQLLASVQSRLGQWQRAQSVFIGILSIQPDNRDAQLGLGRCQLELKNFQASIQTLTNLLNEDPSVVLVHFYLSRDYAGLGNETEAQHQAELHQKMVALSSFSASALGTDEDRLVWSKAQKLIEGGNQQEALGLFRGGKDASPASQSHAYFMVGALNLYLGNRAEGTRNLHRALQLDPRVRGAHTFLGIVDLQDGKLEDAEKHFNAELANDPNYQTALAELGVVRYRQGRWAEAAEQLARSRTRTPTLLLLLCDSYFRVGNLKDAKLTAELIAAYGKEDPTALQSLTELLEKNNQQELASRLEGKNAP